MGEKVKRSIITTVTERLEFCGTKKGVREAARRLAPYAEGWRTTVCDVDDDVVTERYEREVSRDVTPKEDA